MLSREMTSNDSFLQSKKNSVKEYLWSSDNTVVQDLSKASFLSSSKMSELEKLALIELMLEIKQEVENSRKHIKGHKSDPFKIYCERNTDENRLSEKEFMLLYRAVNYLNLELNLPIFNGKLERALQDLAALNLDKEEEIKCIDILKEDNISPKEAVGQLFGFFDKGRISKMMNLIMSIRRVDKMNLLEYVCFNDRYNDSLLENSIVYQVSIKDVWRSKALDRQSVLIEPSLLYLDKFLRDKNASDSRSVIVFRNEHIMNICQYYYRNIPNTRFFDFKTFSDAVSIMRIGNVTVFGNNLPNREDKLLLNEFMYKLIGGKICIFDSDNEFTNPKSTLNRFINKFNISIKEAIMLPEMKNATSPKRKMIVNLSGYSTEADSVTLMRYSIRSDEFSSGYLELSKHYSLISRLDFLNSNRCIRSSFRESNPEFCDKKMRQKGREIEFSNELSIYYTKSYSDGYYRIKALMVIDDGLNTSKIKETIKRKKLKNESEIEDWLVSEYPYLECKDGNENSIRSITASFFREKNNDKNITLKTFKFINESVEKGYSDTIIGMLRKMIDEEMRYTNLINISPALVKESMYEQEIYDEAVQKKIIEVISNLLDIAVKEGYCNRNSLKDELRSYSQNNKHFVQVRNNLVCKQLSINKYRVLVNFLLDKYSTNENLYLALLMKATLGLESNIVCGLKWGDLESISNEDGKTFMILNVCRQLQNNGKKSCSFLKRESYRKIPVNSMLMGKLIKYKQKTISTKGIGEDEIKNYPIIQGAVYCENAGMRVYEPSRLTRISNRVVKEDLKLIREGIVFLPLNDGGTTETNLDNYNGDFLRSNYEHHLRVNVHSNPDDVEYLLGRQTLTTFASHYYDYEDDYSQYLLYKMQSELIEILNGKEVKRDEY